jgi:hypothetical protein
VNFMVKFVNRRAEACRAKGNPMRTLVDPPPSSRCDLCSGELRLKQIELANRSLDLENEIIVCIKCGREQSYTVSHNYTAPGAIDWLTKVAAEMASTPTQRRSVH